MKKKINAPDKVYDLLSRKYNIIDKISFLEFDYDFQVLNSRLKQIKREKFNINDRIVIEHMDTDYYFEQCSVGLNLLNFFTVVNQVDIPKFVFLFYTNHFGLKQEIEKLCIDKNDQPTVIESFIDQLHYSPTGYQNFDLSLDTISHQALCMMHLVRSHRIAMFNNIKDISDENMIKSFTIKKQ